MDVPSFDVVVIGGGPAGSTMVAFHPGLLKHEPRREIERI